jgi:DNA-directed RNA polymerase subunit beta'
MKDGEKTLIKLSDRLFGRVAAEDIVDPKTGEVIVFHNQEISEDLSLAVAKAGVEEVCVRSAFTANLLAQFARCAMAGV